MLRNSVFPHWSLISFVLFHFPLMCLPRYICLSFLPFFCVPEFSLTAHLRHGGCKWLRTPGTPQASSPLAVFPKSLLHCVCRHACMHSRFWITGSSRVLLYGVNNHPNLPAVSPKLHSLISKRGVKIILRLLLHGHVREAVKIILFEITIKSQLGAQQEGIRPPHN